MLTKHSPEGVEIEVEAESRDELNVMYSSDIHADSISCDLDLFKTHLEQANKAKAPVIINGDLFDAMQGRFDPRRDPEDLKQEFKVSSYFDALVMWHSQLLRKFKDIPCFIIGEGNHEASVRKMNGTSLTERLAYDLSLHGVNAVGVGFWGYVRVTFKYKKGNGNASHLLYFHHGKSSGAVVTKGAIEFQRQSVYIRDAQVVLNGHIHEAMSMAHKVERLNHRTMRTYTELVWYLRTPGYVFSPSDTGKTTGWVAEKHKAPKPRGCMFGTYRYDNKRSEVTLDITQKIV
jgi:hypothetical protein